LDLSCWWRESLFLVLLFSSVAALGANTKNERFIGLLEAVAFVAVAASGAGRMSTLGLDLVHWHAISKENAAVSFLTGGAAAIAVTLVAHLARQAVGRPGAWNEFVVAISVGPALEEVIFRGYLLTWLLWGATRMRIPFATVVVVAVSAVLFSAAHASRAGTTALQHLCIFGTGTLYAGLRIRFGSTVSPTIAHGAYNLTLFLWSSIGV
jgi:membrane protease YdiL (CAAX protease family)